MFEWSVINRMQKNSGIGFNIMMMFSRYYTLGFGGMVSVYLRATLEQTCSVVKSTNVFTLAESLGGVESLIELPALMTHASVPAMCVRVWGLKMV